MKKGENAGLVLQIYPYLEAFEISNTTSHRQSLRVSLSQLASDNLAGLWMTNNGNVKRMFLAVGSG